MKIEKGEVDAAFAGAAVVIEAKMLNQPVIPFAMEPRVQRGVGRAWRRTRRWRITHSTTRRHGFG